MMPKRYTSLLILLAAVAIVWWFQYKPARQIPLPDSPNRAETFDRTLRPLIFTKHARCRMGCRHIDAAEIEEILANGHINYDKSEPRGKPDPKYAVEGRTHDNQQVRIIFAPSLTGMVVITCIDLEEEWTCDCK